MKIRQLKFKNINSFYGEHDPISFHQEPLSSAGLFMICGPTGAGKSTLLDVITLALFNEIPRIGKISKQDIESKGILINAKAATDKGTEAYAEVEYEVENIVYRSRWSIKKNRNAKWNDYEMEVAVLPEGKILTNRKSDVPQKNTEIIKLEYKQFVQSIILAQGSFAKFLQANKNDRAKLLEDITGTHIYRKLGIAAHQRANEAAIALRDKESEIKGVSLLAPEEEALLVDELKSSKETLLELDTDLLRWTTEVSLVQKINESEQQLKLVTQQKETNGEKITQFAPKKVQLEQHESVVVFMQDFTILDQQAQQINRLEQQQNTAQNQLIQLTQLRATILDQASTLVQQAVSETSFDESLTSFATKVTDIQQAIQISIEQGTQQRNFITSEIHSSKLSFAPSLKQANLEESVHILAREKQRITPILNAFDEHFNADEQIELITTQQHNLNELANRIQEERKVIELGKSKKAEQEKYEADILVVQNQLTLLGNEIVSLKNLIQTQDDKLKNNLTKQSLQEMKIVLRTGEPCPLCGSLDHPKTAGLEHFVSEVVELNELIRSNEALFTTREAEVTNLKAKETQLKTKVESLKEQISQLREEVKNHRQIIQHLKASVIINEEDLTNSIQTRIQSLLDQRKSIVNWREAQDSRLFIQRIEPIYTLIRNLQSQVLEQRSRLIGIYQGQNIQLDIDHLKQQWLRCITGHHNAQESITNVKKQLAELHLSHEEVKKQLQIKLQEKGILSVQEARSRILTQDTYQFLAKEYELLANEEANLANRYQLLEAQLTQSVANRTMTHHTLESLQQETTLLKGKRDELIRKEAEKQTILRTNEESKKRYAAIQESLNLLIAENRKWELLKNYIGDATGNRFNNFAQNLTLVNLISLANHRLKTLSERYILTKSQNDTDSLYVLDTFQGHSIRSVATLSGGETFTLSLALALALSDMASRNVRIDSLFIDEGFGTLDEETLDTAIYSLEKLQNENLKTVGVISHRSEMKERIPVQIQIDKGIEGCSKISIVCK